MLNHIGTQDIRTERLLLRRFRPGDEKDMFRNWAGDEAVTYFLSWNTHESEAQTLEVLTRWIEECAQDNVYHWAIERNGEVIGDLNVFGVNDKHSSCEIGYVMSPANQGKGYMTEAVRGAFGFLFSQVNMHRVTARHATENLASGRVMQKAGMTYEGILRKACINKRGEYYDLALYAIIQEDWTE